MTHEFNSEDGKENILERMSGPPLGRDFECVPMEGKSSI